MEVTQQEFDLIRASIKSAYPTFNVMPDQYSIRMWYRMLGDLDYKLCETALMELFATHTSPPQISEIREKCAEYTVPHLKDQGEAWGEVQKAISQYGYYRQEEALESLTPIVREAVKRLGFREICLDENQDAVRAHFFKIYSSLIERKTNDAKLPPSILEAKNKYIAQLTTQENVAIEQQHREQIAEEPERATPEYIDMLMREHGFKRWQHGADRENTGNRERVHKSLSRAVLQPEFMAGVGGSDGGNGMYTCKCSR